MGVPLYCCVKNRCWLYGYLQDFLKLEVWCSSRTQITLGYAFSTTVTLTLPVDTHNRPYHSLSVKVWDVRLILNSQWSLDLYMTMLGAWKTFRFYWAIWSMKFIFRLFRLPVFSIFYLFKFLWACWEHQIFSSFWKTILFLWLDIEFIARFLSFWFVVAPVIFTSCPVFRVDIFSAVLQMHDPYVDSAL